MSRLSDMQVDEIGHEICVGIRKGLYGITANDEADIRTSLDGIAEAILDLADAVRELKK